MKIMRDINVPVNSSGGSFFQATDPEVNFPGETISALNDLIQTSALSMKKRARWLINNDDHCKRYQRLMVQNIVGHEGIRLKCFFRKKNGSPYSSLNEKVESVWRIFCKSKYFSMNGKDSYLGSLSVAVRQFCSDGEFLARVVRIKDRQHPVRVQFLSNDVLPHDYVDRQRNVRQGIETDMYSRPLAYHMYTDDPNALLTGLSRNNKIVRIEAKEILHGYLTESPNQLRGICPFVTAIKRLRRLGGYEDAELIASRVGASAMGIVESGSPEEAFRGIQEQEQIELEPGAFIRLQPGEHLNQFRADHPTTAFEAFVKAVLRGIAAGMNISYNSLTTDLESVSYSSIRAGTLSERDFFRIMQTFIINTFCRPLFEAWLPNNLDFGLLSDRLNDAEKRLILQQYEDPAIVKFYPRGWDWVDPLKDVNAAVVELNNGLASKTEILARKGKDIYQLQDELELERQVQNEPTANKVQKQSE